MMIEFCKYLQKNFLATMLHLCMQLYEMLAGITLNKALYHIEF